MGFSRVTLMLGLALALPAVAALAQTPTVAESFLLAAANQDRLAHGLAPVRWDDTLEVAARRHAEEMARRLTISHQFTGERDLAARARAAGARFSLITENVAQAQDPSKIHDLWMGSPGHRANLLDPNVNLVAVSVVERAGEFFAVEDFARSVRALTLSEQESLVASLVESSGLRIGTDVHDARQTCQLASGFTGSRKPWFVMRYTSSSLERLPPELATRIASRKYKEASIGACAPPSESSFTSYSIAVLLYP